MRTLIDMHVFRSGMVLTVIMVLVNSIRSVVSVDGCRANASSEFVTKLMTAVFCFAVLWIGFLSSLSTWSRLHLPWIFYGGGLIMRMMTHLKVRFRLTPRLKGASV